LLILKNKFQIVLKEGFEWEIYAQNLDKIEGDNSVEILGFLK